MNKKNFLKKRLCEILKRIRELENTIGMSIDEYAELHRLYDKYYELSQKYKKI